MIIPWFKANYKSSSPKLFCKRGFLKNFTKFTGKHLSQSLIFNEVAGLQLWNFEFFQRHPVVAAPEINPEINTFSDIP